MENNNNSSSSSEALSDKNEQSHELKSSHKHDSDGKNDDQCSNEIQPNLNDIVTQNYSDGEKKIHKTLEKERKLNELINSWTKSDGDNVHPNAEGTALTHSKINNCNETKCSSTYSVWNENAQVSDNFELSAVEESAVNKQQYENNKILENLEPSGTQKTMVTMSAVAESNGKIEQNVNDKISENLKVLRVDGSDVNSKLQKNDIIQDNLKALAQEGGDVINKLNESKISGNLEPFTVESSTANSEINEHKIPDNLKLCEGEKKYVNDPFKEYSKISGKTESVQEEAGEFGLKGYESLKKSEKNTEYSEQYSNQINHDSVAKDSTEKKDFWECNSDNTGNANRTTKSKMFSYHLNLSAPSTPLEDKIIDNGNSARTFTNSIYSTAQKPLETLKPFQPFFPLNTQSSTALSTSAGSCVNIGSTGRVPVMNRRRGFRRSKIMQPKTFKENGIVYCLAHFNPVNYWCQQCFSSKCEKCVNIAYSKNCRNHDVLLLSAYVRMRKNEQSRESQKSSSACLNSLERSMKGFRLKESEMQLQRLILKDRIRQEFISFHELLIEEERKVMTNLEKDAKQSTIQMKEVEAEYGSLIEEEAKLMCTGLTCVDTEDPYAEKLKVTDKLILQEWPALLKKTQKFKERVTTVHSLVRDRFTLIEQKTRMKMELSTALDPVQVEPLFSTLFLDEDVILSPIKVCEMFTCRNSQYTFQDFVLDVTVICNRSKVTEKRLHLDDYLFNIHDRLYLQPFQRYLVQARPVMPTLQSGQCNQQSRHILIITGNLTRKMKEEAIKYIDNVRSQQTHRTKHFKIDWNNEHYLKWKESKLWSFSVVGGCKEFFDVSPEEMRYLAYSADMNCYIQYHQDMLKDVVFCCTIGNKQDLDLALNVLKRKYVLQK